MVCGLMCLLLRVGRGLVLLLVVVLWRRRRWKAHTQTPPNHSTSQSHTGIAPSCFSSSKWCSCTSLRWQRRLLVWVGGCSAAGTSTIVTRRSPCSCTLLLVLVEVSGH